MAKFTEADVKELAALLHKNSGGVAFLTGAGCSISAGIPPAPKLVEQINKEYPDTVRHLEESKRSDYGACMGILSLAEREELIKPYLENAKINWAHIALATLIEKKFVSRVLTFNFDSVLAHACGLLGIYPATYDFGISPSDRTDYLAQPCIVHLHGQGYGPVMMNSDEETQEHAEKLSPLLTHTLDKYPLIVVGYSGEADQVFEKLTSLYTGRHRLYWLGYSEEPKSHLRAFLDGKHRKLVHYIGGADADQFLIQLAQQLNCFPPQVFNDPAGHLLAEMADVAAYPLRDAGTTDILKNTTARLDKHRTALQFTQNQTAVLNNKPASIDPEDSDISPEVAAWALLETGEKHFTKAETENSISEYEKAAQFCESALNIKPDMHEAFHNWGLALLGMAELQQTPELYQASCAKFETALGIKKNYHEALNSWGIALLKLARLQKDPSLFEAGFDKYQAALKIKPDKHEALNNWGNGLSNLAKLKQDPVLFEASFGKYEAALKIKPNDHEILINWGNTLSNLANLKQDLVLFEASFSKYEAALKIKPDSFEALNNWGLVLSDLGKFQNSPKLFETSFAKYEAAHKVKPDDHEVLYNWGNALSSLGKLQNDPEFFNASFDKYEAALNIKPDLHQALFNWANALSDLAKHKSDPKLFKTSFVKYEDALNIKPDLHPALYNWGSALLQAWSIFRDEKYLKQAIEVINRGEKLNPDQCYNGACLASIKNDEEGCKERLFRAKEAKTLPNRAHLEKDEDLANMRDKPWFAELLKDL